MTSQAICFHRGQENSWSQLLMTTVQGQIIAMQRCYLWWKHTIAEWGDVKARRWDSYWSYSCGAISALDIRFENCGFSLLDIGDPLEITRHLLFHPAAFGRENILGITAHWVEVAHKERLRSHCHIPPRKPRDGSIKSIRRYQRCFRREGCKVRYW